MRGHRLPTGPPAEPCQRGLPKGRQTSGEASGAPQGVTSPARLDLRRLSRDLSAANERRPRTPGARMKSPGPPLCRLPRQLRLPIPEAAKAPGTSAQSPPVWAPEPAGADSCCPRVPVPRGSSPPGTAGDLRGTSGVRPPRPSSPGARWAPAGASAGCAPRRALGAHLPAAARRPQRWPPR